MDEFDETTGASRRDVLKRGAIVGGALVWATPVVQSIGGVAFGATPSDDDTETPPVVVNRAASVTISSDTDTGTDTFGSNRVSNFNSTAGGFNVPRFVVSNSSDAGVFLTAFSITVGDTAFNYDFVRDQRASAGVTANLVAPDLINEGGIRSDVLSYTFVGFDSGSTFDFEADFDPDTGSPTQDFRLILFNSTRQGAANAVATFSFSQGPSLSVTLTGAAGQTSYKYDVAGAFTPVP